MAEAACPVKPCDIILRAKAYKVPHHYRGGGGRVNERHALRTRILAHFRSCHCGLGIRERSDLADSLLMKAGF